MNIHWAEIDERICPCHGNGWGQIDIDVYKKCPVHYAGQLHPETICLLSNDSIILAEEKARSYFQYEIEMVRLAISNLQKQLQIEQDNLFQLETAEIKCTPTIRYMPSVEDISESDYEIEIDETDFI